MNKRTLRPATAPALLIALLGVLPDAGRAAGDAKGASTSQAPAPLSPPEALFNALVLRPSLGEIFFNDFNLFTTGLLLDVPVFQASNVVFSIGTGFLYSPLGSSVSVQTTAANSRDHSIAQVPANLKIAVHPGNLPALSAGPHLGANLIYTSGGLNAPFGNSTFITTPSQGRNSTSGSWQAHPDVGADVDYAFSHHFEVSLRYDATLMSAFNLQTLTLGLGWIV